MCDLSISTAWFYSSGIKILLVLLAAVILAKSGDSLISRTIKKRAVGKDQRKKTIIKVFSSTFNVIVWVIAILTILPELGVNIVPLLAGAGLIGLTIGMGAQSLIKDFLSGVFILIEDQYREGEKVDLSGKQGEVVDFQLRRTVIKDSKGVLHYIPNGQVKVVSNFSRK